MESNDCRRGNWVLVPTNPELKIPVTPKRIKGITKFGEFDFTEPEYPENFLEFPKHCAGIELTREILVKAGAKLGMISADVEIKIGDEHALALDDETGCLILWCNDSFYSIKTQLKYVHQLQNLYFDLINIELEIKL